MELFNAFYPATFMLVSSIAPQPQIILFLQSIHMLVLLCIHASAVLILHPSTHAVDRDLVVALDQGEHVPKLTNMPD